MAILGAVTDAPVLVGFGMVLALDDAGDSSQWFGGTVSRTRRRYSSI